MSIKSVKLREARNRPPEGTLWVWITQEMLESDAWRALSLAEHRVIERVMVEHILHGLKENGNLAVTYADFVKFGSRRDTLPAGIRGAVDKGLLVITEKGKRSSGPDRWPTRYALGWLPFKDASSPRNAWKAWRATPIPGDFYSDTRNGAQGERQESEGPDTRNGARLSSETGPSKKTKRVPGKMNGARGERA